MSTVYEIPLVAQAQQFSISLANVTYNINLYWNPAAVCWVLDFYDSNNNPVLRGVPLVTGVDLLAQYPYMRFGGTLTCATDHNADAVPTYSNIGTTSHLYFTTTP